MAAWALGFLLVAGIESDLEGALERSTVERSGLGLAVGRAGGEPFLVVAPDAPRIPASNQKLLTAAAAVRILGADHRFTTTVATARGGRLVVVGGGDPNLSGRFFDGDPDTVLLGFARDVRGRGVTEVKELVLDASRFDGEWTHPDWPGDQLDRWYCAPIAALVYNDSCWDLAVRPGPRAGAPARVEVKPSLVRPALSVDCPTIEGRGHVVHIGRAAGGALDVRGKILLTSAGVDGHVTVRDPVRFFGDAFRAALERAGVRVEGEVTVGRVPDATPIVRYRSTMGRTLEVMLTGSQNLYAECVFKSLGEGSFASGGEAVLRALRTLEIDTAGIVVRDGSGLAKTNRVTARALYGVLQAMRDEPVFVESLAAGGTGTLRRRYRDLGGRVRAKTGTIRGVSALSGYVTGRDGGRYVFVILANGKSVGRARRLQDLVVNALAGGP